MEQNSQLRLTDAHVHVGPFAGGLMFEPEEVAARLVHAGIERWVWFSTAYPCRPANYIAWMRECVSRMEEAAPGRGLPALWMNENMLMRADEYLDERFEAIKIHEGHTEFSSTAVRERAFTLAEEHDIPLIIHTGEYDSCRAGRYLTLCRRYSSVSVVLAHGRPTAELDEIMTECPNVWVDTAFMPIEQMRLLATSGRQSHTLYGSDYPIQQYFTPEADALELRAQHCASAMSILGADVFQVNFRKTFKGRYASHR